jgi:hypothetical protein
MYRLEHRARPPAGPARPTPKIVVASTDPPGLYTGLALAPSHKPAASSRLELAPDSSTGMRSETAVRRRHTAGAASKETTVECCRRSKPVSWAWLDLNQRPHPYQACFGYVVNAARARDGQLIGGVQVTVVVRSIPGLPARCGTQMARPARTNVIRTCRRRDQLPCGRGPSSATPCLVGKGRRPAAAGGVRGSNPAPGFFAVQGHSGE